MRLPSIALFMQLSEKRIIWHIGGFFVTTTICILSVTLCNYEGWNFMFTLRHKHASTAQRIPLCLAQKPTESDSLRSSEHCRRPCAVRACNLFILYEHARNHAHFMLHYCHSVQVCIGVNIRYHCIVKHQCYQKPQYIDQSKTLYPYCVKLNLMQRSQQSQRWRILGVRERCLKKYSYILQKLWGNIEDIKPKFWKSERNILGKLWKNIGLFFKYF